VALSSRHVASGGPTDTGWGSRRVAPCVRTGFEIGIGAARRRAAALRIRDGGSCRVAPCVRTGIEIEVLSGTPASGRSQESFQESFDLLRLSGRNAGPLAPLNAAFNLLSELLSKRRQGPSDIWFEATRRFGLLFCHSSHVQ